VAVGALSALFWVGTRDLVIYVFGVTWTLAGLAGLLGGIGLWRLRLLGAFMVGTAVVAVATCILFVAAPATFLNGF
jgi:hypothetical protein